MQQFLTIWYIDLGMTSPWPLYWVVCHWCSCLAPSVGSHWVTLGRDRRPHTGVHHRRNPVHTAMVSTGQQQTFLKFSSYSMSPWLLDTNKPFSTNNKKALCCLYPVAQQLRTRIVFWNLYNNIRKCLLRGDRCIHVDCMLHHQDKKQLMLLVGNDI